PRRLPHTSVERWRCATPPRALVARTETRRQTPASSPPRGQGTVARISTGRSEGDTLAGRGILRGRRKGKSHSLRASPRNLRIKKRALSRHLPLDAHFMIRESSVGPCSARYSSPF